MCREELKGTPYEGSVKSTSGLELGFGETVKGGAKADKLEDDDENPP